MGKKPVRKKKQVRKKKLQKKKSDEAEIVVVEETNNKLVSENGSGLVIETENELLGNTDSEVDKGRGNNKGIDEDMLVLNESPTEDITGEEVSEIVPLSNFNTLETNVKRSVAKLLGSQVKCIVCFETLNNYKDLEKHGMEKHPGLNVLHCPNSECSKCFSTYNAIKSHCKNSHKFGVCQICGHISTTNGLQVHLRRQHKVELRHDCEICPARFLSSMELQMHMKLHLEETLIPCMVEGCNRVFK